MYHITPITQIMVEAAKKRSRLFYCSIAYIRCTIDDGWIHCTLRFLYPISYISYVLYPISPETELLFLKFAEANNKGNSKTPYYWNNERGIDQLPVDSSDNGAVMWSSLSFHNIATPYLMYCGYQSYQKRQSAKFLFPFAPLLNNSGANGNLSKQYNLM